GYTEIRAKVASSLKPSKFLHSQGVSDTAAMLAERFGLNVEEARICGIYHDAYRYDGTEDALSYLESKGVPLFPEEVEEPMLLHGVLAAAHFEEDAEGIVPDYMKDAVRHHTLGSKAMGRLGAVIYISDYIEPGRKHLTEENRREILSETSLEDMIVHIMDMQRPYLVREGINEAECSKELYDFLKKGGKL
ncbi:MAG: HD domain-containing protein, partial [Spirochaetales bacterium]|nr:HD domain-containing protein [Candidatus Physcosoma equi]